MKGKVGIRILSYVLGALQLFIGITAILGGSALVLDPSGVAAKAPLEWLNNSPFENYLIPGLLLLIIIGGGHVLGGIFSFLLSKHSPIITGTFGIILFFFMSLELWFIGLRNFMQPMYLMFGVLLVFLCLKQRSLMIKFAGKPSPSDHSINPSINTVSYQ